MKTAWIESIIARIPQLKQCRKFYRLNKGWSSDKKYFIEVLNGRRYLLRLNASEKLAAKKEEYLMMKQAYELGIRMSEPEKPVYQKCSGKSPGPANQQALAVIDFNRWDFGDPYEEFYKMMLFSREQSIPFARGQIQGYFSGEIPEDFFPTLALYLADVILYSVVWAEFFGEEEINKMIKLGEMTLADFDSFSSKIPGWW